MGGGKRPPSRKAARGQTKGGYRGSPGRGRCSSRAALAPRASLGRWGWRRAPPGYNTSTPLMLVSLFMPGSPWAGAGRERLPLALRSLVLARPVPSARVARQGPAQRLISKGAEVRVRPPDPRDDRWPRGAPNRSAMPPGVSPQPHQKAATPENKGPRAFGNAIYGVCKSSTRPALTR